MESVQIKFPHRDLQIHLLSTLLDVVHKKSGFVDGLTHVYGLPATGKTSIVRTVFDSSKICYIYIDCHECSSTRRLFERILRDAVDMQHPTASLNRSPGRENQKRNARGGGKSANADNAVSINFHCPNGNEFVNQFGAILRSRFSSEDVFFLVLDSIDRVRRYADSDPMPILCRLSEFISQNSPNSARTHVVTIGEWPWSKLFAGGRPSYPILSPMEIKFSTYSPEEIIDLLSEFYRKISQPHKNGHKKTNDNFVYFITKFAVDSSKFACTDLMEFDYHLGRSFSAIKIPTTNKNESCKILKENFAQLFLCENLLSTPGNSRNETGASVNSASYSDPLISLLLADDFGLCPTKKYILIAAYLASYNPRKSDRQFFLKHHGKAKVRRNVGCSYDDRQSCRLRGPQLFPLERLLLIFQCLVKKDENFYRFAAFTNYLLTQVATFVSRGKHIQLHSVYGALDSPKFRCTAKFEFVDEIAKSVHFDLKKHLRDYNTF